MRVSLVGTVHWLLLLATSTNLSAASRTITVWLIPSEEAEARAAADPAVIAQEIRVFNSSLDRGRVHVLNARPPLDKQLIVWNEAFAVPTWAWVKNQTETVHALQRFAALHDVDINIRFETWDRGFADLNSPRRKDPDNPPPDVVQIGSTWAAYFASRRLVVSRPDYATKKGPWQSALDVPASVVPYINDIRLLFYWKRLPAEDLEKGVVSLNASSWETILNSIRTQGTPTDQIAFAGGLTLNLLMDYSMMVWAGGGEPISRSPWGLHSDLTSKNATSVPRLLAQAATSQSGRPVVVVPESSHQALTQAFVAGQYRATIEPANFVSRWKKDFDKTFHGTKRFWDYAAAAAPPQTFRGGSYLAVMPSSDLPTQAFELAEFLATDDAYTKVLARNAHLPSLRPGFGMDVLVAWLGEANPAEAAQFTALVQQANIQGKSLPDLPNWPTEIESIEVQEALQRVWRRIGEGNLAGLDAETRAAEAALNLRIDPISQLYNYFRRFWWLAAAFGACVAAAFLSQGWRAHRKVVAALKQEQLALSRARTALASEEAALDQVRRLRGFSAMALLALARYHTSLSQYIDVADSIPDARKRSIIAAGINGWRRGRHPDNWKPSPIETVVWKAVLLAFDVVSEPDIYETWEKACGHRPQHPRDFLESLMLLRKTESSGDSQRSYFIKVTTAGSFDVETPFLLEQALASLLQNAIQASDRECEEEGPRKAILISVEANQVTVANAGEIIPPAIRNLINNSNSPEEFQNLVLNAVRSPGVPRPGIGLTEAYTIASQCYAGLTIPEGPPCVAIRLRA